MLFILPSMHVFSFRFTVVPLIFLMLFVITYTCILGPRHLIMYKYTYYARYLALYMYSQGCVWQPWILMSRSWSLDHGDLAVADQSAQRILPWWLECNRSSDTAVVLPSRFSPVWLLRSLLPYREHLSVFIMYIPSCIVLLYFLVM